ncbi:ribbon-helix-helix domain-containing protein [Candidatus Methanodesulfokora washburnensis]|uniref:Ribbon-helix-helix protein, CopG family n=1 Tax=Candidatus Methanodesulfokora washburnensis TaxID=2478471 RepID=A0A429GEV7_9CREN|nr:ribbon-helix-helix domain-containing protein [Candidatus Methanodesulfokores washburnensis]RSN72283.1 hypothetical protein D6D85_14520 [Candidatus Methanodesulfokores washburnensis]
MPRSAIPPEKRKISVNLSIDIDLLNLLDKYIEEVRKEDPRVSRSKVIGEALREYLQKHGISMEG